MNARERPIYFFLGTKAQYIKTAPVMAELDRRDRRYILIDSGQHADFSAPLRRQLGVREPDVRLGGASDIVTIPSAIRWFAATLTRSLVNPRWLRSAVFRNGPGFCVVHGDTPSTLLATLMARLAGMTVVHIEAGLRSFHWLRPFPEEIIRVITMRLSHLMFTPSDDAHRNLTGMKVKGTVISAGQNTSIEALYRALEGGSPPRGPYAVMSVHRVETLTNRRRMATVIAWAERIARDRPLTFVLHKPTRARLAKFGLLARLAECPGVTLLDLQPYADFAGMLAGADFVVTDGGSVQEECYYLGVPCLLARSETERTEGLGDNVMVGALSLSDLEDFLSRFASLRRRERIANAKPSMIIADALLARAGASAAESPRRPKGV